MTIFRPEEQEKLRKEKAKEAIALALEGRWENAVKVNHLIIESFPTEVEAYNRLGKALSELGRYGEAADAFRHALELSPSNSIAKKNLERLSDLRDTVPKPVASKKGTPQLFIEDSGKAAVISLTDVAPRKILAKMSAGDTVYLKVDGTSLQVLNYQGDYLGRLDPRLALRLARLINGGNHYEPTIISINGERISLIIREAYRHPSQAGIVSFPSRGTEDYKPYIRSTLLKYDLEEEREDSGPITDFVAEWADEEGAESIEDQGSPTARKDAFDSEEEEELE